MRRAVLASRSGWNVHVVAQTLAERLRVGLRLAFVVVPDGGTSVDISDGATTLLTAPPRGLSQLSTG
jgi:hypothetical protein